MKKLIGQKRNARYRPIDIQHRIVSTDGEFVRAAILVIVRGAEANSVLVDKTTGITEMKQ